MDLVEINADGSLRVEALPAHRHPHAARFTTRAAASHLAFGVTSPARLLPVARRSAAGAAGGGTQEDSAATLAALDASTAALAAAAPMAVVVAAAAAGDGVECANIQPGAEAVAM